ADGLTVLVLGGFLASLGWAMIGSTTTALAMDLTDPRSRGRGMATFSISFQVGNGLGAIIAGALADLAGLRAMYVGSIAITLAGLRAMYVGSIAVTLAGVGILAAAWPYIPMPRDARTTDRG